MQDQSIPKRKKFHRLFSLLTLYVIVVCIIFLTQPRLRAKRGVDRVLLGGLQRQQAPLPLQGVSQNDISI